ncbi:HAD family hydrolase [Vibrio sp. DNB22_10_4]
MVIFDFDGVICDSLKLCRDACQFAAKQQNSLVILETNPFRYLDPVTFEAVAQELGLNEKTFSRDVASYLYEYGEQAPFFFGISQAIETIAASHKLFIVSASHSDVIRKQLQRHKLLSSFDGILGGDIDGSKKEKIQQLQTTCKTKAIMLGDSISDIKAANESDALSIAVTWGWQPQGYIEKQNPTLVVHHTYDIAKAVISLESQLK